MEVLRPIEVARIGEIKILQNVRLVHRTDMNPIYTKENLRVQFMLSGEIKGAITCYLCLDGHDLSPTERNYIFPLFVESMNILIGRQISLDEDLSQFKISMSAPKLNMNSIEVNTALRNMTQKYDLDLQDIQFCVLTEYSLEALN
jgi:hypothetical protein